MNHQINVLSTEDMQILNHCFQVFAHLRPHLDKMEFIKRVCTQFKEGYKIAYIEYENSVVAAAGYRIANFLAWGRVLYIDDLITHPDSKRLGCGGALLDWLIERASELGCDEVHLDTGYQRHDAHRLYLNKGLEFTSHHLSRRLKI